MIGCAVQTGVGAVLNVAEVPEGATVLVTGLGGVGLSVVQGAVVAGAARIIVSDPVPARREAALGFGATDALDPDEAIDLPTVVRDLTDGVGVDYAFEAAGVAAIIETAIEATRAGGTTVCVGAPSLDVSITIPMAAAFVASARTVKGCFLGGSNSHRDIPRLLDLWRAGRVDLEGLITARRPLAEVNEGFDDLRAAKGIRTVIEL